MTNIGLPALLLLFFAVWWLIAAGRKKALSKGDLTFFGAFVEVVLDLIKRIGHAIVGGNDKG